MIFVAKALITNACACDKIHYTDQAISKPAIPWHTPATFPTMCGNVQPSAFRISFSPSGMTEPPLWTTY